MHVQTVARRIYAVWVSGQKPGGQLGEFYSPEHLHRVLLRQARYGNDEAAIMLDEAGWGGSGRGRHSRQGSPRRDGPTGGSLNSGVETLGPLILDLVKTARASAAPASEHVAASWMGGSVGSGRNYGKRDKEIKKELARRAEKHAQQHNKGSDGSGTFGAVGLVEPLYELYEYLRDYRARRQTVST